jgi:2-polyprenyl-6-methoxyphenol hydroxylase-like FAD-dependent oxidoreductase
VLQVNGARVLDVLGVLTSLSASATPIHHITQRNTRGDLLSSFCPTQFLHAHTKDGTALSSLVSSYSALHSAIAATLPSSSLQWAKEVTAVERGELGYHMTFSSPSSGEVCADLIVAANGADSSIRNQFVRARQPCTPQLMEGVLVEGVSEGATSFEEYRENELLEIWGNGQRVGVVPFMKGKTYWYATVNTAYAGAASSPHTFAETLAPMPRWVADMVAARRPPHHMYPPRCATCLRPRRSIPTASSCSAPPPCCCH